MRIDGRIDSARKRKCTKSGDCREMELSTRLREILASQRPDVFGEDTLEFPSSAGGPLEYQNFRSRVFRKLVRKAFGTSRQVALHTIRHTWTSLHTARGTPLKWTQAQGGWRRSQMLDDVYGHFMPTETSGFANVLSIPNGPQAAPLRGFCRAVNPRSSARARGERESGADERTPTADLLITSELLYHLSYVGEGSRGRDPACGSRILASGRWGCHRLCTSRIRVGRGPSLCLFFASATAESVGEVPTECTFVGSARD